MCSVAVGAITALLSAVVRIFCDRPFTAGDLLRGFFGDADFVGDSKGSAPKPFAGVPRLLDDMTNVPSTGL